MRGGLRGRLGANVCRVVGGVTALWLAEAVLAVGVVLLSAARRDVPPPAWAGSVPVPVPVLVLAGLAWILLPGLTGLVDGDGPARVVLAVEQVPADRPTTWPWAMGAAVLLVVALVAAARRHQGS